MSEVLTLKNPKDKNSDVTISSGPFAGKRIEFAPQEQVRFVNELLRDFLAKVLGHPEAWVSNKYLRRPERLLHPV